MKLRIVIPKGWRRLKSGEYIKEGDRMALFDECDWWLVTEHWPGLTISREDWVIRRIARGAMRKKQGARK